MLLAHFQTFVVTYYNELRSFTRLGVGRPEYTAENNMILEGPGEGQRVKFVGSPVHMSRAAVTLRIAPPRLGQHTEEVLAEVKNKIAINERGRVSL